MYTWWDIYINGSRVDEVCFPSCCKRHIVEVLAALEYGPKANPVAVKSTF